MTEDQTLAPIAITSGEPAGVGPELVAKLLLETPPAKLPQLIYIGPFEQITDLMGPGKTVRVKTPEEVRSVFPDFLPVLDIPVVNAIEMGRPDPINASAVLEAIDVGVSLAAQGKVRGVVTGPIQKSSLRAAGFPYRGHTDYLGHLSGVGEDDAVMVLAGPGLRVACVTHHIPLRQVPATLSTDRIVHTAQIIARDLAARFGIPSPRIAVAALNPHAGEAGMLGDEDALIIAPAVEALRDAGIDASGPWPADSMFDEALRTRYDIALCMYHDQALIPIKALCGRRAVNVTLGLPFVRTSPDHGTGLDIAGSGTGDVTGLAAAVALADQLSRV